MKLLKDVIMEYGYRLNWINAKKVYLKGRNGMKLIDDEKVLDFIRKKTIGAFGKKNINVYHNYVELFDIMGIKPIPFNKNLMALKDYTLDLGYKELKDCYSEQQIVQILLDEILHGEDFYDNYNEKEIHEKGLDEVLVTFGFEFTKGKRQGFGCDIVLLIKVYLEGGYDDEEECFCNSGFDVIGWHD